MRYPQTWTEEPAFRLNKKYSLNFPEGDQDQQVPDDGWRTQQSKHCDNSNKDENTCLNVKRNNYINYIQLTKILFFSSGL